jgi:hypothetical protein
MPGEVAHSPEQPLSHDGHVGTGPRRLDEGRVVQRGTVSDLQGHARADHRPQDLLHPAAASHGHLVEDEAGRVATTRRATEGPVVDATLSRDRRRQLNPQAGLGDGRDQVAQVAGDPVEARLAQVRAVAGGLPARALGDLLAATGADGAGRVAAAHRSACPLVVSASWSSVGSVASGPD